METRGGRSGITCASRPRRLESGPCGFGMTFWRLVLPALLLVPVVVRRRVLQDVGPAAAAVDRGAGRAPMARGPPGRCSRRHAGVGWLPAVEIVPSTDASLRASHHRRSPRAFGRGGAA